MAAISAGRVAHSACITCESCSCQDQGYEPIAESKYNKIVLCGGLCQDNTC